MKPKTIAGVDKALVKSYAANKADELFPDMLSPEQLYAVRLYRARRRLKQGLSLSFEHQQVLQFEDQAKQVGRKVKDTIEIAGADGLTDSERAAVYGAIGTKSDKGNIVYNGEEDFDILAMINDAEDPVTGTLRDLTINDKDLPAAKNFYDYCFRVMGGKFRPWVRQLMFGILYFGEWCPHCTKDKDWVDVMRVPKDYPAEDYANRIQLLEYGKCPCCGRTKWDLIKNWNLGFYIQLVLVLGQRSGKSSTTALIASYITHRYLKFPHLATLSKQTTATTPLVGTFVSLNFNKAVGVLWTPYKEMLAESDWFQEYHKLLKYEGKKRGKELLRESSLVLQYKHRNYRFYPSGPTANTLRGETRLAAFVDELGLFPSAPETDEGPSENSTSERMNADEMHTSLYNSLLTTFNIQETLLREGYSAAPPVCLIGVSSPVSQRDKVTRLLKESEDDATILGINLATWEVNPYLNRDSTFIVSKFKQDPVAAARDFGAEPPVLAHNYIDANLIGDHTFTSKMNTHRIVYQLDQPGELYARVQRFATPPAPCVLAIDAGYSNNSFSLVGGYYDFKIGETIVSTVIEIMPQVGRKINFNLVYQHVILPVLRDTNCVALLADQWQSIDLLQRAKEDMGKNPKGKDRLLAKQISPKRKQFDIVRSMIEQKSVKLPIVDKQDASRIMKLNVQNYRTEMIGKPSAHLMLQMLTVQDPGPGKAPTKGTGFTDDIWRAFALLTAGMHETQIMERLKEARAFNYGTVGSSVFKPVYISRGYGR